MTMSSAIYNENYHYLLCMKTTIDLYVFMNPKDFHMLNKLIITFSKNELSHLKNLIILNNVLKYPSSIYLGSFLTYISGKDIRK